MSRSTLLLLLIIAFSLATSLLAIQRNLPYVPEADEDIFVTAAIKIASSGNMNPGWFGNPGSTLIYPLALVYKIWDTAVHGGPLASVDPDLSLRPEAIPAEYYLLGRLLSVVYAAMSILLTYQVGRLAFGHRAAMLGAWLFALMPGSITHSAVVRTDSAGTFFSLLALGGILSAARHPNVGSYLLAGAAIGLAIATRYFLVALVPILMLTIVWPHFKRTDHQITLKRSSLYCVSSLLAISAAFALSTPYFFLDLPTAIMNLQEEAHSIHLGADGLDQVGNTLWYATDAIPFEIGWPLSMMSAVGVAGILRARQVGQLVLLAYAATFLLALGTGASSLHFARRLIQILPVLALIGGHGVHLAILAALANLKAREVSRRVLWVSAVVGLSLWPGFQFALLQVSTTTPSTRLQAREWLIQNLPPGSAITQEWYAAPLAGTQFEVVERKTLADWRTLPDYSGRYVVATSFMYDRYFADPDRYASEVKFYEDLFARGQLIHQFEPPLASLSRAFTLDRYSAEPHRYPAGPTIRVYWVPVMAANARQ